MASHIPASPDCAGGLMEHMLWAGELSKNLLSLCLRRPPGFSESPWTFSLVGASEGAALSWEGGE